MTQNYCIYYSSSGEKAVNESFRFHSKYMGKMTYGKKIDLFPQLQVASFCAFSLAI